MYFEHESALYKLAAGYGPGSNSSYMGPSVMQSGRPFTPLHAMMKDHATEASRLECGH